MAWTRLFVALLAVIVVTVAPASAAPKSDAGALDYVDGLEALEGGDYRRAIDSLGRAIGADGDNADYHLARGVANTLAEQFPAAVIDLERAQRLRPTHRETMLWLKSAHQMANDEVFRNPRTSGSCFVHGFDVPPGYAEVVCNRMALEYSNSRWHGSYYDRD